MIRKTIYFTILLMISIFAEMKGQVTTAPPQVDYPKLSAEFIELQKNKENVDHIVSQLSETTVEGLSSALDTDAKKLAFWVNVYNGYIQYILTKNPDLYKDRNAFFKMEQIDIAGRKMSFADIEHGIIRHSQLELFLGYLTNPFPPKYERKLRVEEKDWRIHFALNCGAKSCPPVAIYHPETLDKEFDFMTTKYLNEQTEYNTEEDRAYTVALFSWFRGDFGGPEGVRDILKEYDITPKRPENVKVKTYDWTLDLGNYREIPL